MSCSEYELCLCPNCGNETYYMTWGCGCPMMEDLYPPNQFCKCGRQIQEEDIILSKASAFYKRCTVIKRVHKKMKQDNSEKDVCENGKSEYRNRFDNIKQKMIDNGELEGLI